MQLKGIRLALSLFALACGGFVADSHAQKNTPSTPLKFRFSNLTVPGAAQTDAYGINNSNVIAGDYIDGNGLQHGMILNGTQLTTLDCPTGAPTTIYRISSRGTGVAQCGVAPTLGGFWIWVCNPPDFIDCRWVWIPYPCFRCRVQAFDVNDTDHVAGEWIDENKVTHGFLFNLTTNAFTTFDVPGASATLAVGINNVGLVTLQASDASGRVHSYLYDGKTYQLIDVPGAVQSFARGINNNRDIVFTTIDSAGGSHGAVLSGGKYFPFDDPNSKGATRSYGINDRKNIVGRYSPGPTSKQNYSFEATFQ